MGDWNWFFSSLSQASAAVIGIIGAFVVAKFLNLEEQFVLLKREDRLLTIRAENIKLAMKERHPAWLAERVFELNADVVSDYFRDRSELERTNLTLEKAVDDLLPYFCRYTGLDWIRAKLCTVQETLPDCPVDRGSNAANPVPVSRNQSIENEYEGINGLFREAVENIEHISILESRIDAFRRSQRSVLFVLATIMLMFLLFVVLPLWSMPAAADPFILFREFRPVPWPKIFLLGGLASGITFMFGYFCWRTIRMEFGPSESASYRELENYSTVFRNRREYEARLAGEA